MLCKREPKGQKQMKKIMTIALALVLVLGTAGLSSEKNKIGLTIGTFYNIALPQKGETNGKNNHFSLTGGFRLKFDTTILNTDIDYQSENEDITYIITSKISLLKEILTSGFYLGAGIQKSFIKWASGDKEDSDFTYFIQAGWEIPGENVSLALDVSYELSPFLQQGIDADFIGLGIRLLFYF
jgi:hypothetical protein